MKRPDPKKQQEAVDAWNRQWPPGTLVTVRLDDDTHLESATESKAELLGGHTPVVWLKDITGAYRLDRLTPRVEDLEPDAVRAELVKMFPNFHVGICKVEIWTCSHENNHQREWDIVIGEFAISSLIGAITPQDQKFPTLREAFDVVKRWHEGDYQKRPAVKPL